MKTVLIDLTALNSSHRMRGLGRHVRALASGLSQLSHEQRDEIRIVGLMEIDPLGKSRLTEDFGEFTGTFQRDPSRLDDERTNWLRRFGLEQAAAKIGADLVHLPDPQATPLHLKKPHHLRLLTCHDLARVRAVAPGAFKQRGIIALQRRIQARRFRHADHVIAISSYTAEDLRSLLGLNSSRVSVVYNGIDPQRWSCQGDEHADDLVLRKYGVRNGSYVLYVGTAAWRKNRAGMLRALRYAREARPDIGMQLVWAGRLEVGEASTIDREARNLGIRHAVRLIGYVPDEDLASLYRSASAHLFVSRHEGFGLTIVEAMACGCPVITTRRTALAEVAGDAAVHVEPEEHSDIGDAVIRVTEDQALRQDLIRRGIARAQRFTRDRQAYETLQVYRRTLGFT
jgi:glycosyltransferase involved in cell wall biosynthesis